MNADKFFTCFAVTVGGLAVAYFALGVFRLIALAVMSL